MTKELFMFRRVSLTLLAIILVPAFGWSVQAVPVAVSPGSGNGLQLVSDPCTTFSWAGTKNAQGFTLAVYEVAEAGQLGRMLVRHPLPPGASSWTMPAGRCLSRGKTYAWTVGESGKGEGLSWSEAVVFKVTAGPSEAEFEEALELVRQYVATKGSAAPSQIPLPAQVSTTETAPPFLPKPSGEQALLSPPETVSLITEGAVGVGTDTPLADLHVVGSPSLGSLMLTPSNTTGVASSELLLGADHDGTFGVKLKYDAPSHNFQVWGKSGESELGPWVEINRWMGAMTFRTDQSMATFDRSGFSGNGSGLTELNASHVTSGILGIAQGGTGAADAAGARSNLGAAAAADMTDLLARVAVLEAFSGVGLAPGLIAQPPNADFGFVLIGESEVVSIQMTNTGNGPTGTLATVIEGSDADRFALDNDTCSGFSLDPSATCEVTVRFGPTGIGLNTATLSVSSAVTERSLSLSGAGAAWNNVGTQFYAVPLSNPFLNRTLFSFGVGLANAGPDAANVLITKGSSTVATVSVPPGSVSFVDLPWINGLQNSTTVLLTDAAYHIVSDNPITASQYNPMETTIGEESSNSNEASALLPVPALTGSYLIIAWPSWDVYPGQFAVAATEDETTITITPTAAIFAGGGLTSVGGTITLDRGDVVQVSVDTTSNGSEVYGPDPSGSLVVADKPIVVFGAHVATRIPADNPYLDHLEEQLPPLNALGSDFIFPGLRDSNDVLSSRYVKVVATQDDTHLSYSPSVAGAPTLLNAGETFQLRTAEQFRMTTAGKPVIAASYLEGQHSATNYPAVGDPAMGLAVPISQWQEDCRFLAPDAYAVNRVSIAATVGTEVVLDGLALAQGQFVPLGATGYAVADVKLSSSASVHWVTSSAPVGVTIYGFGEFTSYMYPGCTGLEQ